MARRRSYAARPRTRTRTVYQRARSRARGVNIDTKGLLISAAVGAGDNMINVNPYLKGGVVLGAGVLLKKNALQHCGGFMLGKALTGNGGVVNVGGWL